MELRNRIVMSPMGDDLCNPDGTVSDTQLAYAEARARGGVALVMLGSVAVAHPAGTSNKCQTGISDDRFIPGLRRLAEVVHAHGSKIALQLTHAGKIGINDMIAGRPMFVPSLPKSGDFDPLFTQVTPQEAANQAEPFSSPTFKIEHHPMTAADIALVIEWFAAATVRAREAGIDGIELHAGHGYLLDEFLSPATNLRTDEYGGSVENRARLLTETLTAIRERVGRNYPLWIRMNGHEFFYEGTTLTDAIETAKLAVAAGVDALHVSAYADPSKAIGFSEAHTTHFPGHFVEYGRAIKQQVPVPVITVGRIEPELGDELIANGACDFVAMGRKLLADPDLPNKLGVGQRDDVKPCMYHYRCISQIFIREGVRCAMNPSTGRERELQINRSTVARKVLVIGGGPAGMEAARLAALRGHDVILAEASSRLGGKLVYAAQTYAPNADVLRWLRGQIVKLGVDVRLDTTADAEFARSSGADVVIAALGGEWSRPQITGVDSANVRTVDELDGWLVGDRPLEGDRVVILGGGRAGMGLADLASQQVKDVVVVEASSVFAPQIGLVARWRLVHELQARGVELLNDTTVRSIDSRGVAVTTGDGERVLAADLVLVASRVDARDSAVDALRASGLEVHAVGDCTGAGYIEGAMLDAAELAVRL
jgi:2,4-dienoyl-CoA reductase-like NADH-dependent reductase (Old Yellow Enzyme family)/thioredoxin reductase